MLQINFQQKEDASKPAQVLHLSNVEISSLLFTTLLSVLSVKLEFGQILHLSVKLVPTIISTQIMMEFKLELVLLANKIKSLQKRKVVSSLALLQNLLSVVMFSLLSLILLFAP